MGIELQLITADEAYHNKDGSLFQETGVIVTTPPSSTVGCIHILSQVKQFAENPQRNWLRKNSITSAISSVQKIPAPLR